MTSSESCTLEFLLLRTVKRLWETPMARLTGGLFSTMAGALYIIYRQISIENCFTLAGPVIHPTFQDIIGQHCYNINALFQFLRRQWFGFCGGHGKCQLRLLAKKEPCSKKYLNQRLWIARQSCLDRKPRDKKVETNLKGDSREIDFN